MKHYYVYIMTNKNNTVIYTGVTSNLSRRVWEHKEKINRGFAEAYEVNKLVYCEEFAQVCEASAREKQIKGGSRQKKIALISSMNPEWRDLLEEP